MRRKIKISKPEMPFEVKIANTQEELEKAYSLLHDCYVGMKLMAPDASGLRCNFYSFLPYTSTIVAKTEDMVIGTLSLIKDSNAGLPSDKDFKNENDKLRSQGHRLVEVSSLAIDKQFRNQGHFVSLYLMKYLQHYSTHYMGCTTVTCVIHPRARDFYSCFWGFQASQKIIKYKFVNDALGVQVFGHITDSVLSELENSFPQQNSRNPIKFLFKAEDFLIYPERKIQHLLDPVYTPELLNYFMMERTRVYESLTPIELVTIYHSYKLFFDDLDHFYIFKGLNTDSFKRKIFRFFTLINATLIAPNEDRIDGLISDLSQNGTFFVTDNEIDPAISYSIKFELDSQKFRIPVVLRWRNKRIRNSNRIGYGFEFSQIQLGIARVLKHTHMTIKTRQSRPSLKINSFKKV